MRKREVQFLTWFIRRQIKEPSQPDEAEAERKIVYVVVQEILIRA